MISQQLLETLRNLGLNALEAEVYCELLLHTDGVTAYRLAKLLNKATANVYKSVRVLAELGGVLIQKTSKELCHAVEPEIFLTSLNTAFQERRSLASKLLNENRYKESEEGFYRIDNAALAIQYAKTAIDSAQLAIVIDAFPTILTCLKDHLTAAIKRGVSVCLQSYDESTLEGADEVKTFHSGRAIKLWKTEQLNLVIDGKKSLVCLFNSDLSEVIQAMWSKDLYLACVLHVGLSREHFFHKLKHLADTIELPEELKKLMKEQDVFLLNTVLNQQDMEILLQSAVPHKKRLDNILSG